MPVSVHQSRAPTDCQLSADAVVIGARPGGRVDLEFSAPPTCASCAGTCLWRRLRAARIDSLPVSESVAAGTKVSVVLTSGRVLFGSLLLYGVPLLAILAGALTGSLLSGSDSGTLAGVLIATALLAFVYRRYRRRSERFLLSGLLVTPKT